MEHTVQISDLVNGGAAIVDERTNNFQCHLPSSGGWSWVHFCKHCAAQNSGRTAGMSSRGPGPILEDFHLARFSATDFGASTHPDHLPQLFDFFWNDSECIVASRAM